MEPMEGRRGLPHGFDERLREILDARPEAVERVVRTALAGRPRAQTPRWRLLPAAALLAAAALILRPAAPPLPDSEMRIAIESTGDILVVRSSDRTWIVRQGDAGPESLPAGTLLIARGGKK